MQLSYLFTTFLTLASVQGVVIPKNRICTMNPKLHPNPNLRCGWPGPLDPSRISTIGEPSTVTDLASCADLCHSTKGCISFGLTGESCQIYDRSLLNMNIALPNITSDLSTVFYNKGCWKQECTIAPKPCVCTEKVVGKYCVASSQRADTDTYQKHSLSQMAQRHELLRSLRLLQFLL
jgi:hypothetical protein